MASTKLFSRLHIHKLVNALVQRTWAKMCTTSCPSHVDLRHALANRRLNRSAESHANNRSTQSPFNCCCCSCVHPIVHVATGRQAE
jgi:hypothetical protein